MLLHRRRFLSALGSTVVAAVGHRSAWSQAAPYPSRPVRLIIPFAPGGPNDLAGRLIAQGLSDRLGARFYVENIAGSGGNIGTAQAARAAADGYTVLLVSPSYAANPSLFDKVAYDPARSFDAVTMAVTAPTVLTVHPSIEAQSVAQLIALIRAHPAKFSYASPGTGTPPHLLGELFRLSLGLDLVHVPFNGGGPAIGSTLAGPTPHSFRSARRGGAAEGVCGPAHARDRARHRAPRYAGALGSWGVGAGGEHARRGRRPLP